MTIEDVDVSVVFRELNVVIIFRNTCVMSC